MSKAERGHKPKDYLSTISSTNSINDALDSNATRVDLARSALGNFSETPKLRRFSLEDVRGFSRSVEEKNVKLEKDDLDRIKEGAMRALVFGHSERGYEGYFPEPLMEEMKDLKSIHQKDQGKPEFVERYLTLADQALAHVLSNDPQNPSEDLRDIVDTVRSRYLVLEDLHQLG